MFLVAQNAVHKLKSPEHDLWSLSSRKARAALRDNVRRVLLSSPQEYGEMKLEVMAWQYGVHQVIARVKKEIKELHLILELLFSETNNMKNSAEIYLI